MLNPYVGDYKKSVLSARGKFVRPTMAVPILIIVQQQKANFVLLANATPVVPLIQSVENPRFWAPKRQFVWHQEFVLKKCLAIAVKLMMVNCRVVLPLLIFPAKMMVKLVIFPFVKPKTKLPV